MVRFAGSWGLAFPATLVTSPAVVKFILADGSDIMILQLYFLDRSLRFRHQVP